MCYPLRFILCHHIVNSLNTIDESVMYIIKKKIYVKVYDPKQIMILQYLRH